MVKLAVLPILLIVATASGSVLKNGNFDRYEHYLLHTEYRQEAVNNFFAKYWQSYSNCDKTKLLASLADNYVLYTARGATPTKESMQFVLDLYCLPEVLGGFENTQYKIVSTNELRPFILNAVMEASNPYFSKPVRFVTSISLVPEGDTFLVENEVSSVSYEFLFSALKSDEIKLQALKNPALNEEVDSTLLRRAISCENKLGANV